MYLSQIKMKEIQSKPGNTSWIWLYDRSGSMHNLLHKVGKDLVRLSSLLKKGDNLSLGYFSGKGQYRFILKGFQITGNGDAKKIENIVNSNISSIGLTCFSEILTDTVSVIEELKVVFPENTFALSLLTDGCPVPDTKQERDGIFKALRDMKMAIGDALFIGYGDYYDRRLLEQAANEVGGSLVHTDQIEDFGKNVEITIKTGGSARKVTLDISDDNVVLVFGKSDGQIKVYPFDKDTRKAYVADTEKEVFVITNTTPKVDNTEEDNLYASAYALASSGKIDQALEYLGDIGDRYLVDKLYNSFTVSEIGEATQAIHDAAFDKTKRFLEGKKKNCVPKSNAYCLLYALDTLIEDKDAFFYPSHSQWGYKTIGVQSKVKEGYPKFERNDNIKAPFANLNWNKSRLNLSVLTKVDGKIELPDVAKQHGLEKVLATFGWRNYTLVKDGILNVRKLPVSMSKESFEQLKKGGLIQKNWKWVKDEIYVLDLKRIPIMNRVIAYSYDSATDVANWALEENRLLAEMKAMKYLMNLAAPDLIKATPFTAKYTDSQMEYLKSIGVRTDGSYSPPTETEESIDYYLAKTFEIKVSGWSTIDKIDSILEKYKSGKKLNAPSQAVMNRYTSLNDLVRVSPNSIQLIQDEMDFSNKRIRELRENIQRAKFAVILGKKTFKEFGSVNEGEIAAIDGTKVKFVFGEEKVKY